MHTILGIDCSSKTVGWAILKIDDNNSIALHEHGHIKPLPSKGNSVVKRLDSLSKDIDELCKKFNPDSVLIEEIVQFIRRKSTANTIITLAVFNRAVALQCYRSTGTVPKFLLPISIRTKVSKHLGIERPDKEECPQIVLNNFGDSFQVKNKRLGKYKGQPVVETFDEADAIFAAWAEALDMLNKKTNKITKKKKNDK